MMIERLGTMLATRLDRRQTLVTAGMTALSLAAGAFRAARPLPETGFQYYCCSL